MGKLRPRLEADPNPMLQVGGVQEAMIAAALPASVPVATPLVLTEIDAGADELQVSGTVTCDDGAITMFPAVSSTVGAYVREFSEASVSCSLIDCTAQVVKFTGALLAVPIDAITGVTPGILAVATT